MEAVKSHRLPHYANCGSSARTLPGTWVWHLPSRTWCAVKSEFAQGADVAFLPQNKGSNIFCQDYEDKVKIRLGR